ncbi:LPD11 domain-containing protein [Streptococcus gordonii]|mgnify:FL=1|uniref:LPD11 domain-containing protein n=1 Tax=Streptococcus gordonii TaxID=1302 RepID=UPI0007790B61|nr:LPD11 domain-containing protein [Streptococcus gordonii]
MTQTTITITNTVTGQKAQFPPPFNPMSLSKIGVDETFEKEVFVDGVDTFGYGLDGYLTFYELKDFLRSYQNRQNPFHFDYMMLGRLQEDCNYYLGNGNGDENRLWADNVEAQIAEMKKIWKKFPQGEKPEWLTWEEILEYEKKMEQRKYL